MGLLKSTGLKRVRTEKFYTNKQTVELCINLFKSKYIIQKNDIIIEPSAGNGSFIDKIKEISKKCKFYDIDPEHNEIEKQDFLLLDMDNFNKYKRVHIIGNPPFGRQSKQVRKFIKKSCKFADTISFILPKSFKKESMKKIFCLYYHLILEEEIPKNSFTIEDKIHDVPCIFQIWEKRDYKRKEVKKYKPYKFKFVKKTAEPDISFRRVGINAGKIDVDTNKSDQSHYFIKFFNNIFNENLVEKLRNIKFDEDNTVGPKSISKGELTKEFNKVIKNEKINK